MKTDIRSLLLKKINSEYGFNAENGPSYDELYDLTMERYQNEFYASEDQMNEDHWKFMIGFTVDNLLAKRYSLDTYQCDFRANGWR